MRRAKRIPSEARPALRPDALAKLLRTIEAAFGRRKAKHGDRVFASTHEGLGVVTEEFFELVEAARSNDPRRVLDEALDVAVGALWMVATADERADGAT